MIKLLLLSLFTISAFANTTDVITSQVECSNQLEKYGFGIGLKDISNDCYDSLKEGISQKLIYTNEDEKIEIVGKLNAILIKNLETKQFNITAGKTTKLKSIIALEYNKDHKEIYVLDSDGSEVKTFPSDMQGSISPRRVLRTEQLIGAIDIAVKDNYIYVLNAKDNTIYVYHREASYHRREQYQKLDLVTSYENLPDQLNSIEIKDENLIIKYNDSKDAKIILIKN